MSATLDLLTIFALCAAVGAMLAGAFDLASWLAALAVLLAGIALVTRRPVRDRGERP